MSTEYDLGSVLLKANLDISGISSTIGRIEGLFTQSLTRSFTVAYDASLGNLMSKNTMKSASKGMVKAIKDATKNGMSSGMKAGSKGLASGLGKGLMVGVSKVAMGAIVGTISTAIAQGIDIGVRSRTGLIKGALSTYSSAISTGLMDFADEDRKIKLSGFVASRKELDPDASKNEVGLFQKRFEDTFSKGITEIATELSYTRNQIAQLGETLIRAGFSSERALGGKDAGSRRSSILAQTAYLAEASALDPEMIKEAGKLMTLLTSAYSFESPEKVASQVLGATTNLPHEFHQLRYGYQDLAPASVVAGINLTDMNEVLISLSKLNNPQVAGTLGKTLVMALADTKNMDRTIYQAIAPYFDEKLEAQGLNRGSGFIPLTRQEGQLTKTLRDVSDAVREGLSQGTIGSLPKQQGTLDTAEAFKAMDKAQQNQAVFSKVKELFGGGVTLTQAITPFVTGNRKTQEALTDSLLRFNEKDSEGKSITEALIAVKQGGVMGGLELLGSSTQNVRTALGKQLEDGFASLVGFMVDLANKLTPAVDKFTGGLQRISDRLADFFQGVGSTDRLDIATSGLQEVFATMNNVFENWVDSIFGFLETEGSIEKMFSNMTNLMTDFINLFNNFMRLWKSFLPLINGVADTVEKVGLNNENSRAYGKNGTGVFKNVSELGWVSSKGGDVNIGRENVRQLSEEEKAQLSSKADEFIQSGSKSGAIGNLKVPEGGENANFFTKQTYLRNDKSGLDSILESLPVVGGLFKADDAFENAVKGVRNNAGTVNPKDDPSEWKNLFLQSTAVDLANGSTLLLPPRAKNQGNSTSGFLLDSNGGISPVNPNQLQALVKGAKVDTSKTEGESTSKNFFNADLSREGLGAWIDDDSFSQILNTRQERLDSGEDRKFVENDIRELLTQSSQDNLRAIFGEQVDFNPENGEITGIVLDDLKKSTQGFRYLADAISGQLSSRQERSAKSLVESNKDIRDSFFGQEVYPIVSGSQTSNDKGEGFAYTTQDIASAVEAGSSTTSEIIEQLVNNTKAKISPTIKQIIEGGDAEKLLDNFYVGLMDEDNGLAGDKSAIFREGVKLLNDAILSSKDDGDINEVKRLSAIRETVEQLGNLSASGKTQSGLDSGILADYEQLQNLIIRFREENLKLGQEEVKQRQKLLDISRQNDVAMTAFRGNVNSGLSELSQIISSSENSVIGSIQESQNIQAQLEKTESQLFETFAKSTQISLQDYKGFNIGVPTSQQGGENVQDNIVLEQKNKIDSLLTKQELLQKESELAIKQLDTGIKNLIAKSLNQLTQNITQVFSSTLVISSRESSQVANSIRDLTSKAESDLTQLSQSIQTLKTIQKNSPSSFSANDKNDLAQLEGIFNSLPDLINESLNDVVENFSIEQSKFFQNLKANESARNRAINSLTSQSSLIGNALNLSGIDSQGQQDLFDLETRKRELQLEQNSLERTKVLAQLSTQFSGVSGINQQGNTLALKDNKMRQLITELEAKQIAKHNELKAELSAYNITNQGVSQVKGLGRGLSTGIVSEVAGLQQSLEDINKSTEELKTAFEIVKDSLKNSGSEIEEATNKQINSALQYSQTLARLSQIMDEINTKRLLDSANNKIDDAKGQSFSEFSDSMSTYLRQLGQVAGNTGSYTSGQAKGQFLAQAETQNFKTLKFNLVEQYRTPLNNLNSQIEALQAQIENNVGQIQDPQKQLVVERNLQSLLSERTKIENSIRTKDAEIYNQYVLKLEEIRKEYDIKTKIKVELADTIKGAFEGLYDILTDENKTFKEKLKGFGKNLIKSIGKIGWDWLMGSLLNPLMQKLKGGQNPNLIKPLTPLNSPDGQVEWGQTFNLEGEDQGLLKSVRDNIKLDEQQYLDKLNGIKSQYGVGGESIDFSSDINEQFSKFFEIIGQSPDLSGFLTVSAYNDDPKVTSMNLALQSRYQGEMLQILRSIHGDISKGVLTKPQDKNQDSRKLLGGNNGKVLTNEDLGISRIGKKSVVKKSTVDNKINVDDTSRKGLVKLSDIPKYYKGEEHQDNALSRFFNEIEKTKAKKTLGIFKWEDLLGVSKGNLDWLEKQISYGTQKKLTDRWRTPFQNDEKEDGNGFFGRVGQESKDDKNLLWRNKKKGGGNDKDDGETNTIPQVVPKEFLDTGKVPQNETKPQVEREPSPTPLPKDVPALNPQKTPKVNTRPQVVPKDFLNSFQNKPALTPSRINRNSPNNPSEGDALNKFKAGFGNLVDGAKNVGSRVSAFLVKVSEAIKGYGLMWAGVYMAIASFFMQFLAKRDYMAGSKVFNRGGSGESITISWGDGFTNPSFKTVRKNASTQSDGLNFATGTGNQVASTGNLSSFVNLNESFSGDSGLSQRLGTGLSGLGLGTGLSGLGLGTGLSGLGGDLKFTQQDSMITPFNPSQLQGVTNPFVMGNKAMETTGSSLGKSMGGGMGWMAMISLLTTLMGLFNSSSNKVKRYAQGGTIGQAMRAEKAQSGKKPVLGVLHEGEQILSTLNGDAQLMQHLIKSGEWNSIKKQGGIPSFALGGNVSSGLISMLGQSPALSPFMGIFSMLSPLLGSLFNREVDSFALGGTVGRPKALNIGKLRPDKPNFVSTRENMSKPLSDADKAIKEFQYQEVNTNNSNSQSLDVRLETVNIGGMEYASVEQVRQIAQAISAKNVSKFGKSMVSSPNFRSGLGIG